jgi:CheY-like chemotaxis protein
MEAVLQFRSEHTTAGDTLSFAQRQLREAGGGLQTARVGILLVDDDDDVRLAVQDMLEDAGYRVYSVASGQEAISFFRDNHDLIDLLVSDVVMPTMNGREVYEQLNKLRPGLSAVFITGYSSDILKQLQWAENVKLLKKPLQLRTLIQTIQEMCT